MATSSTFGSSYLVAADWNSLFKEVLVRARTRLLALPGKTAPASPVPPNLRKSRRCMVELVLEVGFARSGAVPKHSGCNFPLLSYLGTSMLPAAKRLHKSKTYTGGPPQRKRGTTVSSILVPEVVGRRRCGSRTRLPS